MSGNERPMVSVVMIAYNSERYIAEAIKGVVKQRVEFPVELIVMDDASTDSTPHIIAEWQARYPNIVKSFRNERNLGIQGNYLAAFARCTGKYLAMCDADDYWFYRRKLSRQVKYMEEHPACAVTFHRVVNYYEDNRTLSLSNGGQTPDIDIVSLSRGNPITNMSVMYRRELIDLTHLPSWMHEEKLTDYTMHLLYAAHGDIHYFKRPMGVYRQFSGATWSMAGRYERLKMSYTVRERLISHFAGRPEVLPGLKEAATNILVAMVQTAQDDVQREYAMQHLNRLSPGIDIDGRLNALARTRKPFPRRLLSAARSIATLFIPRPRP